MDRQLERAASKHLAGKLFNQFLETRSGDSQKHQQSLQYTKDRFKDFHKTKVSALTKEDVEDALWKLPPASYNAHLRRVKSVLNFGLKHGYLAKNPSLLVEPIKSPSGILAFRHAYSF